VCSMLVYGAGLCKSKPLASYVKVLCSSMSHVRSVLRYLVILLFFFRQIPGQYFKMGRINLHIITRFSDK
jgi:hypothetical protein